MCDRTAAAILVYKRSKVHGVAIMVEKPIDTYQVGDKQYVTTYKAARWLKMPLDTLYGQIAFGKLELVQIESQDFVELEALKAYAGRGKRK